MKPVLAKVRERETRGEAVDLWIKTELNGGHHLIRLVSVLLAVAVDSVT